MKLSYTFLLIPWLSLIVAACSPTDDDSGAPVAQTGTLTLRATIDAPVTRASGTRWEANDRIGVTVDVGSAKRSNLPFVTASGDGLFLPSSEVPAFVVDPASQDGMHISAYYPFKDSLNSIDENFLTADNQQDAAARAKIDYLFAEFISRPPTPEVTLTFRHCMARVVLNFKAGEGIDGLKDVTCIFDGVCKGTFNSLTGEAVATGTAADTLALVVPASAGRAECILFPQPLGAKKFSFKVRMGGKEILLDQDVTQRDLKPLRVGHSYTFNILFDNNSVSLTTPAPSEWTDGGKRPVESMPTN